MDYPIAREALDRLDSWVNVLAAPFLPARIASNTGAPVRYELREQTDKAVMIGKIVRAVTGIRAALYLADAGFITESGILLRTVSDFTTEITALGERHLSGHESSAVREFVEQYFASVASTPAALDAAGKGFYVSREALMKSELRLMNEAGVDGEDNRRIRRFVNKGYDAYVHGSYDTTMELYSPRTQGFMLRGHEQQYARCIVKAAVAGKLHEVLASLSLIALVSRRDDVHAEIQATREKLAESGEATGDPCKTISFAALA